MADEPKPEGKEAKPKKEAMCAPFTIRRKVVFNEVAYQPGEEGALRPLLDAVNFQSLCRLGAIVRTELKAR